MSRGALCDRGFCFAVAAVSSESRGVFCRPHADRPPQDCESSCVDDPSLASSLFGRHRGFFRACLTTSRHDGDDDVQARDEGLGLASVCGDARRARLPLGGTCDVSCLCYDCGSCDSSGAASPRHHGACVVLCLLRRRASYPHPAPAPCAACLLLPSWPQSVSLQEAAGRGLWPGRPPRPL